MLKVDDEVDSHGLLGCLESKELDDLEQHMLE